MDVFLYLIQGTSVYSSKYVHIYGQYMAPSLNSYLECLTTSLDNQINFTMNHIQPPPPPKSITLGIYTLLHYSLLWYQPKYPSSAFTIILLYITGLFCATLQHSPEYIDLEVYTLHLQLIKSSGIELNIPLPLSQQSASRVLFFFFATLQPYLEYIALEKYALQYTSHHSISAIFLVIQRSYI